MKNWSPIMDEDIAMPAIIVARNTCLGYGQTGFARLTSIGWDFWPDGDECEYPYLFAENELFFPLAQPSKALVDAFTTLFCSGDTASRAWAGQTITVRSQPGIVRHTYTKSLLFQGINFPWGSEFVALELFDLGWRTECPLFGEWELVDLGTGDGTLTFRKVIV